MKNDQPVTPIPSAPPTAQPPITPAIAALLALVTLVTFSGVARCGFVNFDDRGYVNGNPHVLTGLSWANVAWAFTTFDAANYHPLTWLSLQCDAQFFGPGAMGFHVANLALHALNAVLLFLALRALTGARWRATLIAALFALHPLRVESVAWISERKDVLSLTFGLLALLAYARYARTPRLGGYILVAALMTLSLLAKPMLVTFPALLLLLDFWPLRRMSQPATNTILRLVLEKLPLLVIVGAFCIVTMKAQGRSDAVFSVGDLGLADRLGHVPIAYVRYLGKILWPTNLAIFYPWGSRPTGAVVVGSALLLAAITAAALIQFQGRPWLIVGWLWFLGTLVPVIGLVQVGSQALADRYTYLPGIGVLVMLVWSIPEKWCRSRAAQIALANICLVVLATLGVMTMLQTRYWQNSATLWNHALQAAPHNAVACTYYASALADQGDTATAIAWYREAVSLDNGFGRAHKGLANALTDQNHLADAVAEYQWLLRQSPNDAIVERNLGAALGRLGQHAMAVEHLKHAVELAPDAIDARFNLGVELEAAGEPQLAAAQLQSVVKQDQQHVHAWFYLGRALGAMGKQKEAVEAYRRALQIKPDLGEAHNSLGIAMAKLGQFREAADEFAAAVKLRPDLTDARDNLRRALAQLGQDPGTSPQTQPGP